MRKVMFFVLSLAFMSIVLLGCQSERNVAIDVEKTNSEQQPKDDGNLKVDGKITKVNISKSKGESATVFEDDDSIQTLESIISNAVKEKGIVNMGDPEFYMDVLYDNGHEQSFHVWIGKQGEKSALMKTDDTHSIFTISEEMTNKLIDLME